MSCPGAGYTAPKDKDGVFAANTFPRLTLVNRDLQAKAILAETLEYEVSGAENHFREKFY